MSVRDKILQRLTRSKNLSVERVIEAALTERGRGSRGEYELVQVLLARGQRAGRVALVKAFDRLGEDTQEKLLAQPRELFGPLAEAMKDSEGPARLNAIEIVRRSGNPRLAYLLAEAMIDARPEVRDLAGNSLLEAVRKYRQRSETCCVDAVEEAQDSEAMRKAVDAALKQFRTHKHLAALLAALIFERQHDAPMWSYFLDPHDDLTKAASAILRNPPPVVGASLATGLLLALGTALKPAAMAGLAGTEDLEIASAFARESYRLLDPVLREVAQGIGTVKALALLWKFAPPDSESWTHWFHLVNAAGLQPVDRLFWLKRLLERADSGLESRGGEVGWKLCVIQVIAEVGLPESGRILARAADDADERVARVATRFLMSRRHPEWRSLLDTIQTTHASVRRMLGAISGEGRTSALSSVMASAAAVAAGDADDGSIEPSFSKVWNEYPRMPPAVQGTAARASAEMDPAFAEELKAKLAHPQPGEIAQALKVLNTLPSVTPFRGQIIALCGHPDTRIAAIAVKLIGKLADPKLKDLLEAAAQHADPRVRANAIESMEELHVTQTSRQVLAMLNSRFNRERANAIKAISAYDFNTARECLVRMLADPNPLHRVSALWVVEQLQLPALFRQVATAGRRDPNARVRKRAADLVETLTGQPATPAPRK